MLLYTRLPAQRMVVDDAAPDLAQLRRDPSMYDTLASQPLLLIASLWRMVNV